MIYRPQASVKFERIKTSTAFAEDFRAAGYFEANINKLIDWQGIHAWCSNRYDDPDGTKGYSWTGGTFWFLTPEDRDAFVEECQIKLLLQS